MNKYSKIAAVLLCACFSLSALAESTPSPSRNDSRIRHHSYNANDVTVLSASYGFVTAVIFSDDEAIIDITSGFKEGWDINASNNILYIKPIAVNQNSMIIVPNEKDWRTNIAIRTNKRFYVFEAVVVEPASDDKYYAVSFRYPQDEKAAQEANQIVQQRQAQVQAVQQALAEPPTPRNWNYTAKINAGSQPIAPDYAFDDGTNIYLGFARSKSIPSPFVVEGEQEIIANFSMRQDNNNFAVMVIHNVTPFILLRNGEQVVGVFNRGYGAQEYRYEDTISPIVERVLR